MNKGTYILLIKLEQRETVRIGKLGIYTFDAGWYAYVGSAMNGLDARLRRHFGMTQKKIHWHIDYLLKRATPRDTYIKRSDDKIECTLGSALSEKYVTPVPRFGSSDCSCKTHLFYLGKKRDAWFIGDEIEIAGITMVQWIPKS